MSAELRKTTRARARAVVHGDGTVELWLPRELKSPNRNPNGHWSTRHAERKAWQAAITNALIDSLGVQRALVLLPRHSGVVGARGDREKIRRRFLVTRLVPNRRNFIKDADNLMFSIKRVKDSVKQLGLIVDDSLAWIDTPMPTQAVSADKQFWTILRIEPILEAAV